MALYDVVKLAKDGAKLKVGTVRIREGEPVELELRVPVSGRFHLVPFAPADDETTVSRARPRSGGWTITGGR